MGDLPKGKTNMSSIKLETSHHHNKRKEEHTEYNEDYIGGTLHRHQEHKKSRSVSVTTACCFIMKSWDEEITRMLVDSLECNDMCIIDNFLDPQLSDRISQTTRSLYNNLPGLFTESIPPAEATPHHQYRSDLSCWIKGTEYNCEAYSDLTLAITNLMKKIAREYHQSTNKRLRLSHKSKLQVSCFPAGCKGYRPHIDNPNNNGRIITLVYYPNENYNAHRDDGMSRFYVKNNTRCIEVEPKNNRLLMYWSDRRVFSETLPSNKDIFSLSCWYFGYQKTISQ